MIKYVKQIYIYINLTSIQMESYILFFIRM